MTLNFTIKNLCNFYDEQTSGKFISDQKSEINFVTWCKSNNKHFATVERTIVTINFLSHFIRILMALKC